MEALEILYIVLGLAMLIFSGYSLFSYLSNRGSFKKRHAKIMAELQPARYLSSAEQGTFENFYKKQPEPEAPVYRIEGPLEYVGLKVQGNESKEFAIGGIRVAPASVARVGKKDAGLLLEQICDSVDEQGLQTEVEEIQQTGREQGTDEAEIVRQVKDKLESALFHTAELVFIDADKAKKPAYLLAFDDWKLPAAER